MAIKKDGKVVSLKEAKKIDKAKKSPKKSDINPFLNKMFHYMWPVESGASLYYWKVLRESTKKWFYWVKVIKCSTWEIRENIEMDGSKLSLNDKINEDDVFYK